MWFFKNKFSVTLIISGFFGKKKLHHLDCFKTSWCTRNIYEKMKNNCHEKKLL